MLIADRLGLKNTVFADPVAKDEVQHLLRRLDVGVFHLRRNGVFRYGISSNKLFDYMASGLPIISACSTEFDPVALSEAGVSIEPDDGAALSEAMFGMASLSADERAAMGARGIEYVTREHDLDVLAQRLADLLVDLTATRSGTA